MKTLDKPFTRLSGKEYSPLVIRRFSTPVLHWVAIITDDNLDSLDNLVRDFWKNMSEVESIQDWRNLAGLLVEKLVAKYEKVEGAGAIISADKILISSLYGDFMTHLGCRLELYTLLNLSNLV